MIKLKNILKEIQSNTEVKKFTYSWLSPGGNFFPVKVNHYYDAIKFFRPNNSNINSNINIDSYQVMRFLWRRGWQRITCFSKESLYSTNGIQPPNDIQKRKLIDLAKELNFEKLVYLNDEGVNYVLWSINDILEENR